MNYLKSLTTGLLVCVAFAACNSDSSNASGAATTTADTSKATIASDTSMKDTANASATTVKKKKLKASLGEMDKAIAGKKYTKDKSGVYDYAEVMPSFKGGSNSLDNYVNNNLNVPQSAIDDSKEGTIRVMFTVDENGKVMDAHSMGTKLGDGLDEEAVRVVSTMPKWETGTIAGKPVKVSLTLPIAFKTQE